MCRFWAVNCTKMRSAAGLRQDPLGELKRSPSTPGRYKREGREGRKGKGRKEFGIVGREGTEGKGGTYMGKQ